MKWLVVLIVFFSPIVLAQDDGELQTLDDGAVVAWDETRGQWVSPVEFWQGYVVKSDGRAWGRGTEYPPYEQVNEYDTFMVEVETGPCLMEFFHSRWRRANDVRRWDPGFNEYGGCPNVFD